jgi:hypothetical protein
MHKDSSVYKSNLSVILYGFEVLSLTLKELSISSRVVVKATGGTSAPVEFCCILLWRKGRT